MLPSDFTNLSEFNIYNAYPIIKISKDEYILFQGYKLVEALYESPFYWMLEDKTYKDTAFIHRGDFTETVCHNKLTSIFGEENVYRGVDIVGPKKAKLGEIDILAVFGNRAIIVQAKSKKLTLEARKGNDKALQKDFKKSIQAAYNQGYSCASLLIHGGHKFSCTKNKNISIDSSYKEIYIFCILCDHYPALNFQSEVFLDKKDESDIIKAPFISDLFCIDIMTEFLKTPLYFLNYTSKRIAYTEKLGPSGEHSILAFYLKSNLWFEESQEDLIMLDDSCSVDLDLAFITRRRGLPGSTSVDGFLSYLQSSAVGRILKQIDNLNNPDLIELGFLLLDLSGEAVSSLSQGVEHLVSQTKKDKCPHDLTVALKGAEGGLSIHCSYDSHRFSSQRLSLHCRLRKYLRKSDFWFGIYINPETQLVEFSLKLSRKWQYSNEMERLAQSMLKN